jgi:hypothetical protein
MASWNFENAQQTIGWPWGIGVKRGDMPKMSGIDKFGYLPTATTSYKTVWDGDNVYTYPSSAVAMTVTSAAGATDEGVEITVIGLDENWTDASETVTLNASGTATTTTTFIRVFRAYVSNGQSSTDTVTIANGGTTYAQIEVEYQQTMMAVYTIPAGKRGYLISGNLSVEKSQPVVALLMVRLFGGVLRSQGIVSTFGVPFQRNWNMPPVLPEKTDIEIRAKAGATTSIAAGFEILLEDK